MKSLIIYTSVHQGNTDKIADEISKAIGADLTKVGDYKEDMLEQYDLIGFGSGVYFGKHHKAILDLVEKSDFKNKPVFVFSTSGTGKGKYNAALTNMLKNKNANVVGEFCCKGYDTYGIFKWVGGIAKGHPNNKDLDKTREFAAALMNKCAANQN